MQTPEDRWLLDATSATQVRRQPRQAGWKRALNTLPPPIWAAGVTTVLALGLLLAFKIVVADAVAQGEVRRTATAQQVEGRWRCKQLREPGARGSCLVQVDLSREAEPPPASAQAGPRQR